MLHNPGQCPQCNQVVTPTNRLEVNKIRRDVLECPNCQARLLQCRLPGCRDYALGGQYWDNDFCPSCTKNISQTVISGGLAIALGKFLGRTSQPRWPWPPYRA